MRFLCSVPDAAWLWYCAKLYSPASAGLTIRFVPAAAAPVNSDRRVQFFAMVPRCPVRCRRGHFCGRTVVETGPFRHENHVGTAVSLKISSILSGLLLEGARLRHGA